MTYRHSFLSAIWGDLARLGQALLPIGWQVLLVALLLATTLGILQWSAARVRGNVALLALGIAVVWAGLTVFHSPPAANLRPVPYRATVIPMPEENDATRLVRHIVPLTVAPAPAQDALLPLAVRLAQIAYQGRRAFVPLLPWLGLVWAVGSGVRLVQLVGGYYTLARWQRVAATTPALHWQMQGASLLARLLPMRTRRRDVRVLYSRQVDCPAVAGVWQPCILLPPRLDDVLTPNDIERLLAHELAHIVHADPLLHLLDQIAITILWWHPAAHWMVRQVQSLRERGCDEAVVSLLPDRLAYAQALTHLEQSRVPAFSVALQGSGGDLSIRIQSLLAQPTRSRSHCVSFVAAGLSLLLLLCVPLLAVCQSSRQELLDRALLTAVAQQNLPLVTRLLVQGANPNARQSFARPQSTPQLLGERMQGRPRGGEEGVTTLHLLLAPTLDQKGHAHARPENVALLRLLLDKGANPNQPDPADRNSPPLTLAAVAGKCASIELLLAYGADINARDDDGWTALTNATIEQQTAVVRVLLTHRADPNRPALSGRKPALYWTRFNTPASRQIRDLLLQAGAKPLVAPTN